MPTSLPEVEAHLKSIGLGFERSPADESVIVLGFPMNHYKDSDGDHHAWVLVRVADEGKWVRIVVPEAYNLKDCKFKGATLAALSEICFRRRSVQCGYDPRDGEVVYSMDMWVLDGALTELQLHVLLRQLLSTLDELDPVVRHAMETGTVNFELAARDSDDDDSEEAEVTQEMAQLVEEFGGLEALRAAVEARRGHAPKKAS